MNHWNEKDDEQETDGRTEVDMKFFAGYQADDPCEIEQTEWNQIDDGKENHRDLPAFI